MRNTFIVDSLNESIQLLEQRQEMEWLSFTDQLNSIRESAKPANIMKGIWNDLTTSPDLSSNVSAVAVGMAAGYLSKKIVVGNSHNPLKKLIGILIQSGVSFAISKNPDLVDTVTDKVMNGLSKLKHSFTSEKA
jgi:hypothetical protein